MNNITIILTSSLLAAVLTSFVNWLIQRNNYRNDYYKKLLDKRLNAYEQVEILISRMKPLIHLDNGTLCNIFFATGRQEYELFVISLLPTITSSFWLSEDISTKITEFNVFLLNEISYRVEDLSNEDAALLLEQLGVKHRQGIKIMRKELEEILYRDLKSMHEIKKFIKREKRVTGKIILQPPSFSKQNRL